eukprot:GDKH01009761.1.p2 GENE.GDKH01009761.1~~GDKH01009761.1.p2  ORF type:complete len:149 (+),score=15.84 GDKH01009761.1:1432-1878(+)
MIDNISFDKSKILTFGYHVVFKSQQLVSIKHGEDAIDENGINASIGKLLTPSAYAQDPNDIASWLDITPLDGCAKFIRKIIINNVGSSFSNRFREVKVDIQQQIDESQKQDEQEFNEGLNNAIDGIVDEGGLSEDVKSSYLKETWNQK